MTEAELAQAAQRAGLELGFVDGLGQAHRVGIASIERLLATLGPPAESPPDLPQPLPAHLPPSLVDSRRWGLSVQLYGLRSRANWGIGDFSDLAELAEKAARAGAVAIQLSPLHALFGARPAHCAPYSPSSRLFLNPLFIDVSAAPGFQRSERLARLLASPAWQRRLARLRAAERIDYPAVAALKRTALRILYAEFLARADAADRASFLAFRRQGGSPLHDFGLFEALDEHFAASHPGGWPAWPAAYRDRDPETLRAFVARHPAACQFPIFLQWLARTQLEQAQDRARAAGMAIGLIADLAVGAEPGGAEVWADRELYALDAELGAPPDAFAVDGQAWGLPPWRPQVLVERHCRPLLDLLKANLHGMGGLRVDHIIGFERQFWVPRGANGRDGAYLRFPREAMLAALTECSRNQAGLIIGEDLGTVPEGFQARMRELALLSTRVLRFERYPNGLFRRPTTWPELACACAGTHDLPTLAGWLRDPSLSAEHELLKAALVDAGTAQADTPTADLIPPIHAFLAATPSRLLMLQLEDLLVETEPANRPGTESGNWQRRYAVAVDALDSLPAWRETAERMAAAGRA